MRSRSPDRVPSALLVVARCRRQEPISTGGGKLGTVKFANSCAPGVQPDVRARHGAAALVRVRAGDRRLQPPWSRRIRPAASRCGRPRWRSGAIRSPRRSGRRAQMESARATLERATATGAKTARERDFIAAAGAALRSSSRPSISARGCARIATRWRGCRPSTRTIRRRRPSTRWRSPARPIPADKTYADQLKAGAILEKLWRAQPDHPGMAHYIIHSYDVPALAPRAVAAARRYAKIAPDAPHALHMPSHTFTRLGYWQDSIDTNILSAAAARKVNAIGEELHASDYQVYAYLQSGQDAAARRLVESLPEILSRRRPVHAGGRAAAGRRLCASRRSRRATRSSAARGPTPRALEPRTHPVCVRRRDDLVRARARRRAHAVTCRRRGAAVGELQKSHRSHRRRRRKPIGSNRSASRSSARPRGSRSRRARRRRARHDARGRGSRGPDREVGDFAGTAGAGARAAGRDAAGDEAAEGRRWRSFRRRWRRSRTGSAPWPARPRPPRRSGDRAAARKLLRCSC